MYERRQAEDFVKSWLLTAEKNFVMKIGSDGPVQPVNQSDNQFGQHQEKAS